MYLPVLHRVNSLHQLRSVSTNYGVEIDLRWSDKHQAIVLQHDITRTTNDFTTLDNFLSIYSHKLLILNIKDTGIEEIILEKLSHFAISNFVFLDLQFPVIEKLLSKGVSNIAIRFSDLEPLPRLKNLNHFPQWVWLDCFNSYPDLQELNKYQWSQTAKKCLVHPHLQGHLTPKTILDNLPKDFFPDAVCMKQNSIDEMNTFFKA